jgi:hypothetical protein
MPNHRQPAHERLFTAERLNIWQSAVLAYASANCGITFTSIDQIGKWLRINPQDPQHPTIEVAYSLLLVEPPKNSSPDLTEPSHFRRRRRNPRL